MTARARRAMLAVVRVARVLASFVAVLVGVAGRASAVEVSSDCQRLTAAERDEFEARARLTLHASSESADLPSRLDLRCGPSGAWIEWHGRRPERVPVDEQAGTLEGAIRAVERRLEAERRLDPQPRDAAAASRSPGDAVDDVSFPEPRAASVRRSERPRTGGLALALRTSAAPVALGPDLSLGIGTRGVAVSSSQSLKLGPSFTLFGLRLGVGYGAPYTRGRCWGVHAFGGWQGLAGTGAAARTNVRTTATTRIFGAGVRASRRLGPGLAFIGLDLTFRPRGIAIDPSFGVELLRWEPEVVLGWATVL